MPIDHPASVPDTSIAEHHLEASAEHGECGGCPIARREFLREGTILAAAAVAAIAIPGKASGLSARFVSALEHSGRDARYAIPSSDGATIDRDNDVFIARVAGRRLRTRPLLSAPAHGNSLARDRQSLRVPQAPLAVFAGRGLPSGTRNTQSRPAPDSSRRGSACRRRRYGLPARP